MENQGNTLINTEKIRVDENALVLIKKDCTINFTIPKLKKTNLYFKVLSLYAVAGLRRPTLVHVNFSGLWLIGTVKTKECWCS